MLLARRRAGGKHEGRAVQLVLQARGDDADHAFVEAGVEHADRRRRLVAFVEQRSRQSASACSRMPPSISRRSRLMPSSVRASSSARAGVVGQQAFDAQRHVGQAPGGVDARAQRKAEVEGGGARAASRAGRREQRGHARLHARRRARASGPAPPGGGCWRRACTTSATVPSATRSSRASSLGCAGRVEHAALAQLGAQRQQHVEHHADAGDGLALEAAAGLVGVDDDVGVGQHDARRPARAGGGRSPAPAGRARARAATPSRLAMPLSTVISTSAPLCLDALDDGRRQAVAVAPRGRAPRSPTCRCAPSSAQAAQRHGAGGGAVAVVVGHDAQALVGGDGVGQQRGGLGAPFRPAGGSRRARPSSSSSGVAHAARGKQPRQQRVHAGLLQRPGGAGRDVADYQFS